MVEMTHIKTVHQVEQLLDAILPVPSLSTFYFVATVLEMLGWGLTFGLLTGLSNSRCWLHGG